MRYSFCLEHQNYPETNRSTECLECVSTFSYRVMTRQGTQLGIVARHSNGDVYQVTMAEGK